MGVRRNCLNFASGGVTKIVQGEALFVWRAIHLGELASSELSVEDSRAADFGLRIVDCAGGQFAELLWFAAVTGAQNSLVWGCAHL